MKILYYDNSIYKQLKHAIAKEEKNSIGILVNDDAITEDFFSQVHDNGWDYNHKFYLIMEYVTKNTLESLKNGVGFWNGAICYFTCDKKATDIVANYCFANNMEYYTQLDRVEDENRRVDFINGVNSIYEL